MNSPTKTDTDQSIRALHTVLSRRTIDLSRGTLAYVDQGDDDSDGPAALFLHGVLANADLWRNVIWDVADLRRCIAPDLPAHGATPVPADATADLSLHGLAAMLDELCGRLGLEQVDLVANDTGARSPRSSRPAIPSASAHSR